MPLKTLSSTSESGTVSHFDNIIRWSLLQLAPRFYNIIRNYYFVAYILNGNTKPYTYIAITKEYQKTRAYFIYGQRYLHERM